MAAMSSGGGNTVPAYVVEMFMKMAITVIF
jgi:hypothetical protein